jgi:Uma2 family endonuclease
MATAAASAPLTMPPSPAPFAEEGDSIWRLTVSQYHEMIRAGILTDDDPVELLEGLLVQTMPRGSSHRRARRLLLKALAPILPPGWEVDCQDPITTSDSEPEPDVLVFRTREDDYGDGLPGPQDCAIIIEIADSSLRRDRGVKKRLYARAAVREYWIANLVDRRIEVYTEPSGPADKPNFAQHRDYEPSDVIPVVIDGREVGRLTVADLLP